VKVLTLAQLIERISGIGRRWYAGIPAVGEGKAQPPVRLLDCSIARLLD
jgi:hypothetical protein